MRKMALTIIMLISWPVYASANCDELKEMGEIGIERYFWQIDQAEQSRAKSQQWMDVWGKAYRECVDKTKDRDACNKKTNAKHPEPDRVYDPKFSRLEEIAVYASIYNAFCKD